MSPLLKAGVSSELVLALLAELEMEPKARKVADAVASLTAPAAVVVSDFDERQGVWTIRGEAGGVARAGQLFSLPPTLVNALAEGGEPVLLRSGEFSRDHFQHLDVRREVVALTYIPLRLQGRLLGCIEVLSLEAEPSAAVLEEAAGLAEIAASAFYSARSYEAERNAGLGAVSRMVQLYDIEKIFCATLEMGRLLPVICGKVQELAEADCVNLWMIEGEELQLMRQAGDDGEHRPGDRVGGGTSLVEQVGEDGEPRRYPEFDGSEPEARDAATPGASLMAAPMIHEESLIGVLEVIRRSTLRPYTDDDLFTLTQVADSGAQALHNSSLLEAERKIEILQMLVSVSQEITSTLNQAEVQRAIVNQPRRLFPYERAALALPVRTGVRIRALSDKEKFDDNSPEIAPLRSVLEWVSALDVEVFVTQKDGEISDSRPDIREKFRRYFEGSGSRAIYAIPLADEQGTLGALSFESHDPEFLTELHREALKILAGQVTVALRNATLYKDVPFIGLLEPMMAKRKRLLAGGGSRRAATLATIAAALLLLLVPVPIRVSGQALVDPSQTQYVRAEQDGVVAGVFVHEGEQVPQGAPLIQMADWTQRANLAGVEARYNTASTEAARALVGNDLTQAGQRELEANYLHAELARSTEELARTTIHAALPGIVSTPQTEDLIGRRVLAGDPLLEMVSTAQVTVDVAVPQRDVMLLHMGDRVRIKLESLPLATLRGQVMRISTSAEVQGEDRVFMARVAVANPHGEIRPGMQGFAKIRTGLRPLAVFLLRTPTLWAWSKLWSWFS